VNEDTIVEKKSKIPPIKELRRICQGNILNRDNESWYGKIFIRKISIYLTKLILIIPPNISANQITLFGVLLNLVGAIFLATGKSWYLIAGALILQGAFILDCVDGEIARYRKTNNLLGRYAEKISDGYISNPLIFMGLSIGVYNATNSITPILCGFSASFAFIWSSAVKDGIFATVVEARTKNPKFKIIKGDVRGVREKNEDTRKRSTLSFLYNQKIYGLFGMATAINLILIGALINLYLPVIYFGFIKTTPLGLILLFYGIFPHVIWAVSLIRIFKQKEPDEYYEQLFEMEEK
jgi:phosphatidylglycerophosphate synthase